MAKLCQINRNKKREKMVAQYAGRRAALKARADDMSVPPEDRFAARLKLASCRAIFATRLIIRCDLSGRARGYYRKVRLSASRSGNSPIRSGAGHDQGELVGERDAMAINDPIGDLLAASATDIARLAKVSTPASSLRARAFGRAETGKASSAVYAEAK